MEPSNPQSEFKDERIHKIKEQLNADFKEMNLTISSIEELIRMFQENVLGFNCAARRYAENLSRLLAEQDSTPLPNFDAKPETNDNASGEIRGEDHRESPESLPPMADKPEIPKGDS